MATITFHLQTLWLLEAFDMAGEPVNRASGLWVHRREEMRSAHLKPGV